MNLIEPRHESAVRRWLVDLRALSHAGECGDAARAVAIERRLPKGAPGLLRATLMSGRSTWELATRHQRREPQIRAAVRQALDALAEAYRDCAPGAAHPAEHEHRGEAPSPATRAAA